MFIASVCPSVCLSETKIWSFENKIWRWCRGGGPKADSGPEKLSSAPLSTSIWTLLEGHQDGVNLGSGTRIFKLFSKWIFTFLLLLDTTQQWRMEIQLSVMTTETDINYDNWRLLNICSKIWMCHLRCDL